VALKFENHNIKSYIEAEYIEALRLPDIQQSKRCFLFSTSYGLTKYYDKMLKDKSTYINEVLAFENNE
jgi:hypothetical protein